MIYMYIYIYIFKRKPGGKEGRVCDKATYRNEDEVGILDGLSHIRAEEEVLTATLLHNIIEAGLMEGETEREGQQCVEENRS